MRKTATITKANHYFRIHGYFEEFVAKVVKPFCAHHLFKLGKEPIPGTNKQRTVVTHVFARSNYDKSEYRLPVELLKPFIEYAEYRGYKQARIALEDEPEIPGLDVEFEFNPGFDGLRPGQDEWVNYMLEDDYHLKINNGATGFGKTAMSIHCMVKMGKRALLTMQPRYIFNWIKELHKFVKIEPGDIVLWENNLPSLAKALEEGKISPKIIILPMSRVEVFLRKKDPHVIDLDEVIKVINPGLRIIDEGHEAIHQIVMSLMYGNVKKTFVLSATLKADDPFTNKIYQWVYPIRFRLKDAEPEHYIDVVAYLYRINLRNHRIKTDQFGSYNDKAVEESILKSPALTKFYFLLADKMFQEYYLDRREEGTKGLFFFSRVNMCETMLGMFRAKYPDMDIETFTGEDSKKKDFKDKYLRHEVIITTPNSCGTGKDIPGLVTVMCMHTVSSTQANKQMIGRLRELLGKFGGRITPTFVFGVCVDLNKHMEYLGKREVAFFEKQKTFKRINSECSLD